MASIESIRQRAISKLTRKYGKAFVRYLLTPNHTTNALVPPAVRDLTDAIQSSNDLAELKRFDTAARDIMGGRIQPTELRRVLRAAPVPGGVPTPPPTPPPPLTPTREEFVKLQEKLATANEEIDAYDKELKYQVKKKEAAIGELEKAQESVRKLAASGASSDAVRNLEAALEKAQNDLKKCNESKYKLLGKIVDPAKGPMSNELCKVQRKRLLKQKEALEAKLETQKELYETLQRQPQNPATQTALKECESREAELKGKLSRKEKEISDVKDNFKSQVKFLEERKNALTQKVIALTEKWKKQKERADKLSAEKKERGVLLKNCNKTVEGLKAELKREDLAQRLADGDSNTKKAFDECNKKVEDLESLLLSATKDLTKDREDSAKTISDLKAETEKLRMMLDLQITPDEDLELVREELETAEKYLDEFKGIGTLEEIRKRLTDCEGLQNKFKNLQSTLKTTRESLEDKEKELEGKEKELEGKQEQIAKALRTKLDEPAGRGGATSVSKAPELTSECNWGIPSGFVSATDVDKKVTVAKIFEFAQSVQFDPKKILVYSNKSDTGVRNYYCPILSVNIEGANKTVTVNKYGKEVVFYVRNGEGNLTKKDFYVQKKAFSAFLKPDRGVQLQKIKTMLGRPGESKPDAAQKFKKGDIIADSKGTYRVDIVNGDKRLTTVELNDDGDYVNDVNKTRKKRIGDPKKYTKVTTRETSNDSSGPRTRRRNWQFEGLVPALPSIRIPERHEM